MLIKRFHTSTRYSEIVTYNGVAYLCGQVGEGATVTAQTQDCLAQVDKLLAEVNSSRQQLLQAVIWLSDMADYAEMNAVWDAWIPQGFAPARACGEAKLAAEHYKVEIIITAACA